MELLELQEWRKKAIGSQDALAEKIGRDQHAVSRYERGISPIPPDVAKRLKTLGYNGPTSSEEEKATRSQSEMEIPDLLDETESVLAELKRRGFKAATREHEHELRKLVAGEVRDSFALGRREPVIDRVVRWLQMAALRKESR